MSEFMTAEGVKVAVWPTGGLLVDGETYVGAKAVRALREHFLQEHPDLIAARARWQHQEDARLGRWRWPENPDYVVYQAGDLICVTDERSGHGNVMGRGWYEDHKVGLLAREQPNIYAAAGAYFNAHPEPKPWHDAKEGEVWVLTLNDCEGAWLRVYGAHGWQAASDPANRISLDNPGLTTGRRIWPEPSA